MAAPIDVGQRAPAEVPTGNTYDKYATKNPIEQRLMDGFFATLDAMLPAEHPQRILEVGAGEGEVTARIRARYPDSTIVALDLPDPGLVESWGQWQGVFGSADRLPFPPGTFDLVLAIEVLEHVPHPRSAVAEIARVCRGQVIASVPREPLWRVMNMARGKYLDDLGNTPGHIQHWSRRTFVQLMAGQLRVERVANPVPWTVACGSPQRRRSA
jgi:ubiquinone/menaquinone biosynthesis C-methylase UbiE